jgi:hypothetical protein
VVDQGAKPIISTGPVSLRKTKDTRQAVSTNKLAMPRGSVLTNPKSVTNAMASRVSQLRVVSKSEPSESDEKTETEIGQMTANLEIDPADMKVGPGSRSHVVTMGHTTSKAHT